MEQQNKKIGDRKTVGILGCGWFGLALARRLCAAGYAVRGSTTDPSKMRLIQAAGARPFVIRIEPGLDAGAREFFNSEIVVVNFPPQRRDDIEVWLAGQTRSLVSALVSGGTRFVIFISSTSVYAELGRVVTEEDASIGAPSKPSAAALRRMEKDLLQRREFDATVLRFAGLIGYDRNPREFLKKRPAPQRPDLPVNLIHRDDCVEITAEIIEREIKGEIFNAVCDRHPMRSEFYEAEAKKAGVAAPEFKITGVGKIVSGEKLKKFLGYKFIHPDPLAVRF